MELPQAGCIPRPLRHASVATASGDAVAAATEVHTTETGRTGWFRALHLMRQSEVSGPILAAE